MCGIRCRSPMQLFEYTIWLFETVCLKLCIQKVASVINNNTKSLYKVFKLIEKNMHCQQNAIV